MRRKVIAMIIALASLYIGVNPDQFNQIVNIIDPPPPGYARVLEVFDGDTISVQFGDSVEKVRLIGVDTPETHHPDKAVQCFGQAASDYLNNKLANADVRLEADPTNSNRDRYNRLLRYVYHDDELVNLDIVANGYGFAYTSFPFERAEQFESAEKLAELDGRGLWSACEVEIDGEYVNTAPAADAF